MSINERIKDVRKSASLSQTDFAEHLGTTRGVITNLEGCKTTPNEPFIKLICREFNVDEHWLRTGEGDMFQKLTRDQELAEFFGKVVADPDDAPRKRFISIMKFSGMLTLISGTVLSAIYIIFSRPVVTVFINDTETISDYLAIVISLLLLRISLRKFKGDPS